jgi:hypothetical protein
MSQRKKPVDDAIDGRLLFDLSKDPGEQNNVLRGFPEIAADLESLLDEIKANGSHAIDYRKWERYIV